jgi:tRNA-specific 2-thiouridylase
MTTEAERVIHPSTIRAVALLSGGLDSTLAIKMMLKQGILVTAVNFTSPFCTCSPRRGGCHLASEVARRFGVELRVFTKGEDYLEIVRNPRHGYGRGLNPCIDCRIYILRKVAALMDSLGAQFVVTGEVLGQRPMSQHLQALKIIERESRLEGKILRPLSARLLQPTLPEINGWVDRKALLAIAGRSRQAQLALARAENLEVFSCGSGGCLLTDRVIAARLRDVFQHQTKVTLTDARLCTLGRHFRLSPMLKIVLGRDESENDRLKRLAPELPRAELIGPPGPTAIICGALDEAGKVNLAGILRYYSPKASGSVPLQLQSVERVEQLATSTAATESEIKAWRIEPLEVSGKEFH